MQAPGDADQPGGGAEDGFAEVDGVVEVDGGATGARGVTLNQIVALLFAAFGLRIGFGPLHDNSFFTHLATGRLIFENGAIPRADPYSFTAFGEPWTVQSWLTSVVYAGLEKTVGLVGVRLLVGAVTTALALLVWRLTRPAEFLVGRLMIAVPALAVGATRWVERPLIFGLLFLGAVLLVLADEIDPRWLIPVMWMWVNMHGTFPLGLMAIGAFGLGRLLDRERPTLELRAFGWAMLGTLLGAINPLGPRILTFSFQLYGKREAFAQIVEWQAPTWQDWGERFFALQLVMAVVLLVWRGRSWRAAVPLVIFGALALQSSRNVLPASLVLLPGMALAAKGLGSIDGRIPSPGLRPVRAVLVVFMALIVVIGLRGPDTSLGKYPVASVAWMRDNDLLDRDDRVVTRDFVGNFLEVKYGPDRVRTYMDDRVDMYPVEIIKDYSKLMDPDQDYAGVLDRADATAVLWNKDTDFGRWIVDPDHGWVVVHEDDEWLVAVPAESVR